MAFDLGTPRGRVRPTMNVTPLVDVVLVLLIIFMVVTPLLTKRFWVHVPAKDDKAENQPPPPDEVPPVLLSVASDGTMRLNGDAITATELPQRLQRVFAARRDNVMFFDAADDVPYGTAMAAMDLAREGGALSIAPLTDPMPQ